MDLSYCDGDLIDQRTLLLPADGKNLRRYGVTMSDTAIRVVDLGKRYQLGALGTNYRTLRDSIVDTFSATTQALLHAGERSAQIGKTEDNRFWALKDINFEVKKGQVLGSHRQERGREKHIAKDPLARHRTDGRICRDPRPGGLPVGSGHRISS